MKIEGACHPVISVCPFKGQRVALRAKWSSHSNACGCLRHTFLFLWPYIKSILIEYSLKLYIYTEICMFIVTYVQREIVFISL